MLKNKTDIKDISFILALQLVLLPSLILAITALLFRISIPITGFHFPVSVGCTLGISYFFARDKKRLFMIAVVLFILLLTASFLISAGVYDFSFDGQVYHQAAVILLEKGWNPVHYHFLGEQDYSYWKAAESVAPLIEHFTKASWITGASVFAFTNSLEGGKMFHFLFMAGVFMVALHFLFYLDKMGLNGKFPVALVVALNPVCLYQVFSFYNDGLLASMLTMLAISSFEYILFDSRRALIITAAVLPTLMNIKFTGLIYAGVFLGLTGMWLFFTRRKSLKRYVLTGGVCFLISSGFIGYQPYITNIIHKSNPFYPAITFGTGDKGLMETIETGQAPKPFLGKNRFVKLGYSLFSRTENRLDLPPRLKIPFGVYSSEIAALGHTDARYGGFGPLFGGVLFILFVSGIVLFRWKRRIFIYLSMVSGFLLFSVFINPEVWWARLSPQLWLLPAVFIVGSYYCTNHKKMIGYIRGVVIGILFINCMVVFAGYSAYNLEMNGMFKRQMSRMANISAGFNKEYVVAPLLMSLSMDYRLRTFGVKFKMVEKLPPGKAVPITGGWGAAYRVGKF